MRDRPLLQLTVIGVIAALIGTGISLLIDWFPQPASVEASQIDLLYDVLLIASVPIFVLVMTVAIYSVIKFRARPGDTRDGPPTHGNARLEVVWVTIPFLLVSALAVYGWLVLIDIEEPEPDALVVDVRAEQFTWSFAYPQEDGPPVLSNELRLPVDRQAHFRIETEDVIHSFWVPAFRLKQDTVPGITTTTRLTPTEEGEFDVVCAELCGIGHSTMRQSVRVMPEEEFTAWLTDAQEALAQEGAEAPEDASPAGLAGQRAADEPAAPEDAGATETGSGTAEDGGAQPDDGAPQGDGGGGSSGGGG